MAWLLVIDDTRESRSELLRNFAMDPTKSKRSGGKRHSQSSEQGGRNNLINKLPLTLICLLIVGFSVIAWNRCSRPATVASDYEGVIVDRWAGYSESDQGSMPYFRLVVEDDNRRRLTVNVDADTYHRSQVGMRLSNRQGKIELGNQNTKPDD